MRKVAVVLITFILAISSAFTNFNTPFVFVASKKKTLNYEQH